jgi:hypothetical protein
MVPGKIHGRRSRPIGGSESPPTDHRPLAINGTLLYPSRRSSQSDELFVDVGSTT